jgi:hypothetical protein
MEEEFERLQQFIGDTHVIYQVLSLIDNEETSKPPLAVPARAG